MPFQRRHWGKTCDTMRQIKPISCLKNFWRRRICMSNRQLMSFIVSCFIVVGIAFSAFAQQRGAAPAANAGPMEDRRPPLFLKETFKMDKMEEIYLSQVNIASPNVDLKIY